MTASKAYVCIQKIKRSTLLLQASKPVISLGVYKTQSFLYDDMSAQTQASMFLVSLIFHHMRLRHHMQYELWIV